MSGEKELKSLDGFLEDIQHLKNGNFLLECIWREIGPYRDGHLSDNLWWKIQDFFGFDDSE